MSRDTPATIASRMVFCWYRKPGFVSGSTWNQVPHSSTIRPTRFDGSYRSMIFACIRIFRSMSSAQASVSQ